MTNSTLLLDQLYQQHYGSMLKFAQQRCHCTAQAEDMVMEALTRIAPRIANVRPAAHSSYWRRAVLNVIIEGVRHNNVLQMLSIEVGEAIAQENGDMVPQFVAGNAPVYADIESLMLQNAVRESVMILTEEHREVILRKYFADEDLEAISAAIGRPPGTVKSRLGRARAALKKPLQSRLDR